MEPERWLPLLAGIFLLGALLRVPFLTTFSATLGILIGAVSLWRRHALDGVAYRRRLHYRRGFPGEQILLQIEVENQKPLPLSWLRVEDPWPLAVAPEDETVLAPSHLPDQALLTNVFALRWFETARREYRLLLRKRGLYKLGPARLESGDVFGMYEISREDPSDDYVAVFPLLLPMEKLEIPAEDPYGDVRSRRRIFEDPTMPMGIREYRPEDGFRDIHWPATARTGQLQVKIYQPTTAQVTMVCLNTSTFDRHWEGVYPELLEHVISTAATFIYRAVQDGHQVGLLSNGCLAHADRPLKIAPSRSPKQLGRIFEALAGITPMVMTPFETFLLREMPRVPYGASLMVVTAVTPPELMNTLAEIKRYNRRITLISLAQQPPQEIPGVLSVHRPFEEADLEPEEGGLRAG